MILRSLRSRSVLVGLLVTILSTAAAVLPVVWATLPPEALEILDELFGAELMALVGIAMIVLRTVTTKPLSER